MYFIIQISLIRFLFLVKVGIARIDEFQPFFKKKKKIDEFIYVTVKLIADNFNEISSNGLNKNIK